MTLNDLRRAAIKGQTRIHFDLSNGMTCMVDEHGIARVPALKGPSPLNLEQELQACSSFARQPAGVASAARCTREQIEAMLGPSASPSTDHDHEE